MKICNKLYNVLKYVALIVLPALCCFLTTFGDVWNIQVMPKIVATITALATFLGALLQISTNQYWKENPDEKGNDDCGV